MFRTARDAAGLSLPAASHGDAAEVPEPSQSIENSYKRRLLDVVLLVHVLHKYCVDLTGSAASLEPCGLIEMLSGGTQEWQKANVAPLLIFN